MRPNEPATPPRRREAEVVLGDDWVRPDEAAEPELRARRARRAPILLNRSPLARKIIFFNLIALVVLIAGVLFLNPIRDSLVAQRQAALVTQAVLTGQVLAARVEATIAADPEAGISPVSALATTAETVLATVPLRPGIRLRVLDPDGAEIAARLGAGNAAGPDGGRGGNVITGFLNAVWDGLARVFGTGTAPDGPDDVAAVERGLVPAALQGHGGARVWRTARGDTLVSVTAPVHAGGAADGPVIAVVALSSAAGEIDALVRDEREQVLQFFVIALLVSIGLSLVLASTIANPLAELAAAAELGRDRNSRQARQGRVRLPDLSARPDEIGRLSIALRGMLAALYDRLESNEQFAADVAHEIKNPLASLRSAVGTLRVARRDDQRETLLNVIDHDVRRLDRLVSDISNASRLDTELVREQEEPFDLLRTLRNLTEYLGREAEERGIDFIVDLPEGELVVQGLEARLAQVFVNLITNALSFCEEGDAVRVWARSRENRVLVVVEDTGPGIPDQALEKIFKRFYSERPVKQFGNHSGLGLAISKQIVEAHGGAIWAENIRKPDAERDSPPLGARFVVGLPV